MGSKELREQVEYIFKTGTEVRTNSVYQPGEEGFDHRRIWVGYGRALENTLSLITEREAASRSEGRRELAEKLNDIKITAVSYGRPLILPKTWEEYDRVLDDIVSDLSAEIDRQLNENVARALAALDGEGKS